MGDIWGHFDGNSDTKLVETAVGASVGDLVGALLGPRVGETVGAILEHTVEKLVNVLTMGDSVGAFEGNAVEMTDDTVLGSAVGDSVGV